MHVELSLGNGTILTVLRSRVHWLLSSRVLELQYVGRRSGRSYQLPVQYARRGRRLVVVPQRPAASTWWRNFSTPQPVEVRLGGRLLPATAHAVQPADSSWRESAELYQARWRRLGHVEGPIVEITLPAVGTAQPLGQHVAAGGRDGGLHRGGSRSSRT